jgi:hypothetical protein
MRKSIFSNQLVKIAWAPFIVLIIHILATLFGWYEANWWFDIPLHFLGGMAISLSAYYLLEEFSNRQKFHNEFWGLRILLLVAITAMAAVAWEFMEFTFDNLAQTHFQPSLVDTIKDLAIGLNGGGLVAILTLFKRKK